MDELINKFIKTQNHSMKNWMKTAQKYLRY